MFFLSYQRCANRKYFQTFPSSFGSTRTYTHYVPCLFWKYAQTSLLHSGRNQIILYSSSLALIQYLSYRIDQCVIHDLSFMTSSFYISFYIKCPCSGLTKTSNMYYKKQGICLLPWKANYLLSRGSGKSLRIGITIVYHALKFPFKGFFSYSYNKVY